MKKQMLNFRFEMPNLQRAEHGRLAFEVYAHVNNYGHTMLFEARVRLRYSGRFVARQTFDGTRAAQAWLREQATNPPAPRRVPVRTSEARV